MSKKAPGKFEIPKYQAAASGHHDLIENMIICEFGRARGRNLQGWSGVWVYSSVKNLNERRFVRPSNNQALLTLVK
jgi:hypothetical protein